MTSDIFAYSDNAIGVLGATYPTNTKWVSYCKICKGKRERVGTLRNSEILCRHASQSCELTRVDLAGPLLRDSFDTSQDARTNIHMVQTPSRQSHEKFLVPLICMHFVCFLIHIICLERLGVRCLLVEIWAKPSGRNCLKSVAWPEQNRRLMWNGVVSTFWLQPALTGHELIICKQWGLNQEKNLNLSHHVECAHVGNFQPFINFWFNHVPGWKHHMFECFCGGFFFQLQLWSFMDRILGACMQTIYIMCFLPAYFISLFKPGFLPTKRAYILVEDQRIKHWPHASVYGFFATLHPGATWPRSKGNVNTYSIHGANGYDRLSYKFGFFGRVKKIPASSAHMRFTETNHEYHKWFGQ